MGIRLTENDFLLFRFCFEHSWLDREKIKKYIWKHLNKDYVRQRLGRLKQAGYIKYETHPWKRETLILVDRLTEKLLSNEEFRDKLKQARYKDKNGNEVRPSIPKNLKDYYKYRDEITLANFEHDQHILTSRLILEKEALVENWISDRILWTQDYKARQSKDKHRLAVTADALFNFRNSNSNNKLIAFEFENTRKKKPSYLNKFARYILDKKVKSVLIICKNGTIFQNLKNNVITVKNELPFFKNNFKNKYKDLLKQRDKAFLQEKKSNWQKHFALMKFDDLLNKNFTVYNRKESKKLQNLIKT